MGVDVVRLMVPSPHGAIVAQIQKKLESRRAVAAMGAAGPGARWE